MAEPTSEITPAGDAGPLADALMEPIPPRRAARRRRVALGAVAVVVIGAAVAGWAALRPGPRPAPVGQPAQPPLIALVDPAGALVTVDANGNRSLISSGSGAVSGFPAWSPDGRRLALIREAAAGTEIAIVPVSRGTPAGNAAPDPGVVIYRSSVAPPFYLYWTPDGGRVSFLATEGDEVSLRVAPADGSAPLDGSGPGAVIRKGAPLYYDWVAADRLLLHVGTGDGAFLGEVGADGSAAAPGLAGAGDFRSAVAGADGRFIAFVRGGASSAALVVSARDGSAEHTVPVAGPAAAVFDPAGATVAAIAADRPELAPLAFPIGPLRLVDAAAGTTRTLLDGTVVGFFWSPDGRTIAALRLQTGSGSNVSGGPLVAAAAFTAAASPSPAPAPSARPGPVGDPEVHLLFVNVADGVVRSDRVVQLASRFVNQFLPYFDQYALSHRVWAPDGRSILLPLTDLAGRDRLFIVPADGSEGPAPLDGQSGFWSP